MPTDATLTTCDADWQLASAAAIVDLVERLAGAEGLTAACHTLANEVQAHLGCTRVAVGLRRRGAGRCRLAVVSGVADCDPRSEMARQLEAAFDETLLRGGPIAWPAPDARDGETSAGLRKIALLTGAAGIVSRPLATADGTVIGVWTFFGAEDLATSDQTRRFLDACTPPAAASLGLLERAEPAWPRRVARRMLRAAPWLRRRPVWAAAAAVAAVLLVPMPYNVGVECEMQPVVRRFVAAPYAGEFHKTLAKPGDIVKSGQTLGRMEGRDVRWELAGLAADRQRAAKSHDANMAAGKIAAAQMDRLEMDRFDVKRRLLEDRLEHLEIKSPIDGIVLSGDLERSEGVPVTVGQVLYEVAPLQEMVGELAVADDEITHVEAGMPVTVRLDSCPTTTWSGRITRLHPRSITREKDNVFLAEVPMANQEQMLRPGMKGRATIRTSYHMLGWIVFHKPWDYLVSWLGW